MNRNESLFDLFFKLNFIFINDRELDLDHMIAILEFGLFIGLS